MYILAKNILTISKQNKIQGMVGTLYQLINPTIYRLFFLIEVANFHNSVHFLRHISVIRTLYIPTKQKPVFEWRNVRNVCFSDLLTGQVKRKVNTGPCYTTEQMVERIKSEKAGPGVNIFMELIPHIKINFTFLVAVTLLVDSQKCYTPFLHCCYCYPLSIDHPAKR